MSKVVVVGGGTAGLATAWSLARRGHQVEVLERFVHVNEKSSHGGFTRIIRHAYHEGSDYVRLVSRSDELWGELAARSGEQLLVRCGLLEFGAPDDPEFQAANRALEAHGIAHEVCSATEAGQRWPVTLPDHWRATFSPDSGYLRVQACLDALRNEARAAGATVRYGVRVRELIRGGDRARVLLADGTVVAADQIVVAAGPYAPPLLHGVSVRGQPAPLHAERRVLAWSSPNPDVLAPLREMPVWGAFVPEGFFYGFPYNEEGVRGFKCAVHFARDDPSLVDPVNADRVDREAAARDLDPLRRFLERYIPTAVGPFENTKVCMYCSSTTGDFLIDRHAEDDRFVVATGLSGHGFKFAPVLGEIAADVVESGTSEDGLECFTRGHHPPLTYTGPQT